MCLKSKRSGTHCYLTASISVEEGISMKRAVDSVSNEQLSFNINCMSPHLPLPSK